MINVCYTLYRTTRILARQLLTGTQPVTRCSGVASPDRSCAQSRARPPRPASEAVPGLAGRARPRLAGGRPGPAARALAVARRCAAVWRRALLITPWERESRLGGRRSLP